MYHFWKTADLEVRHPCILSGITYVWQSTAPQSRCSWPERRSLRSSPSTGWTSTRLSPPQRSPPRLPAGPPSSNRAESLEPTKLFKLWQLPLILSEDQQLFALEKSFVVLVNFPFFQVREGWSLKMRMMSIATRWQQSSEQERGLALYS